jgi:hypothetical protein
MSEDQPLAVVAQMDLKIIRLGAESQPREPSPEMRTLLDLRLVMYRTFWLPALCLLAAGVMGAQPSVAVSASPESKLYVAPMEWNLDRFVGDEIRRQGLPVDLVATEDEADLVMTGLYQKLGSHFIAPGNYIQVRITAAADGRTVWANEVNDFAVFFGRLRRHGPRKAAEAIVKKLRHTLREFGRLTAPPGRAPTT